jgi:hypothetical protein
MLKHTRLWFSELSLTRGGPFFQLERRLALVPQPRKLGARLALCLVGLTWVPVALFALAARLQDGFWPPLFLRSEVHFRMLGALVLFSFGEAILERRAHGIGRELRRSALLPREKQLLWNQRIAAIVKLRDAVGPELALIAFVYGLTSLAYFGELPPWAMRWLAPTLHEEHGNLREAFLLWGWYVWVSQPLFLFILGRWLLRWFYFTHLLWYLASLRPRVQVSHTDGAGGLGFLASPLMAMQAFTLGAALTLLSAWLDEIVAERLQPAAFTNEVAAFVFGSLLVAQLPYLLFTPLLVEAQEHGVLKYTALMNRYTRLFERRWFGYTAHDPHEYLLGHSDFSGLADLGTSFKVVERMRRTIPSKEDLKGHMLVSLLPFLFISMAYRGALTTVLRGIITRFIGGGE